MQNKNAISRPSLLFVTPDRFSQDIPKAIELTKAIIEGGASLVQVRDRKGTSESIVKLVKSLIDANIPPHKLLVNGMAPEEVVGIDEGLGVHIKEKDIKKYLIQAKNVMPSNTIIGCAVHNAENAKAAVDIHEPSYFQVGTMFATPSHPGKIPEGPTLLKEIREVVGASPMLIGIGGIGEDNIETVIGHGADGVAVVTLLAAANNPTATATSLLSACQKAYVR